MDFSTNIKYTPSSIGNVPSLSPKQDSLNSQLDMATTTCGTIYSRGSPASSTASLPKSSSKRKIYSYLYGNQDLVHLSVKNVIGTTAIDSAGFSSSKNLIAYTAGAGAVVLQLQKNADQNKHGLSTRDSVQCIEEKFFCSPPKFLSSSTPASQSSALTPLNPLSDGFNASPTPKDRDAFGFVIPLTPIIVKSPSQAASISTSSSNDSSASPGRSKTSKEKVKSTTCVALSSDARLLAVGETGHIPHILIFSLALDSTQLPLVMLNEHRFGIKCLSFSSCGKYLASLGDSNDGFLHIWSLTLRENGGALLHSSNKCLSAINDMKWVPDTSVVITAGVRHIRIWTVLFDDDSNGNSNAAKYQKPYVLQSRNVVLGAFNNSNFVSIAIVNSELALVATEKGEVGSVALSNPGVSNDDTSPAAVVGEFTPRISVEHPITVISYDQKDRVVYITGPEEELT